MRDAPDILQRRRAGRQECVAGQYREDREGDEDEPAEVVRKSLSRSIRQIEKVGYVCFGRPPSCGKLGA